MDSSFRFFAATSRGTEDLLADELTELGIDAVEPLRGGVAFGSSLEHGYRARLWSRIASRILMPVAVFEVASADDLYAGVHAIPWIDHLRPDRTLAVDVAGSGSPAGPPHFVTLKVKDAIVDRIRSAAGRRPDIDTDRPDLRVHVHLRASRVTISIDLAGRGLHRRGRAAAPAEAPMKETLAAAILRAAGWPRPSHAGVLLDPMCGSATVLVEAAAAALEWAPGLARSSSPDARGWSGHDRDLWERLRLEAEDRRQATRGREIRIVGFDASRSTVRLAADRIARAGLADVIRVEIRDLREASPPRDGRGTLVTNPPYGARLGEAGELGPLYETLGDVLKRRFPGWHAWVLSGNRALDRRVGLRAASRRVLYNGPIECRLLEFPISDAPPTSSAGPGWRRPDDEARGFANRLASNARRLRRWAARDGLTAYRLYDSDVPEYNLSVDWYDGAVRVEEYARPNQVDPALAERRLRDALRVVPDVLGIESREVRVRVRRRLGDGQQHERIGDAGTRREVREGDLRFLVNLDDYLDTGLFLDDRLLRRRIRERAHGTHFLNLFAYTCAASVAAAAGGALSTVSVDLSRAYLAWGEDHFRLNGHEGPRHRFVRANVMALLARPSRRRFDQIFVAPPTRSRSKAMTTEFDLQRDHADVLGMAARNLAPDGELLFATHLRTFALDDRLATRFEIEEITREITPFDFARRPRLRAWSLRRLHER